MADTKISALTSIGATAGAVAVGDLFAIVDVSDTTMAASGTTKSVSAAVVARKALRYNVHALRLLR